MIFEKVNINVFSLSVIIVSLFSCNGRNLKEINLEPQCLIQENDTSTSTYLIKTIDQTDSLLNMLWKDTVQYDTRIRLWIFKMYDDRIIDVYFQGSKSVIYEVKYMPVLDSGFNVVEIQQSNHVKSTHEKDYLLDSLIRIKFFDFMDMSKVNDGYEVGTDPIMYYTEIFNCGKYKSFSYYSPERCSFKEALMMTKAINFITRDLK